MCTLVQEAGLGQFAVLVAAISVLSAFCVILSFFTEEAYLKQRARAVGGALFSVLVGACAIAALTVTIPLAAGSHSPSLLIGVVLASVFVFASSTIMLVHHVSRFN
jgi:hypothetical protein